MLPVEIIVRRESSVLLGLGKYSLPSAKRVSEIVILSLGGRYLETNGSLMRKLTA